MSRPDLGRLVPVDLRDTPLITYVPEDRRIGASGSS